MLLAYGVDKLDGYWARTHGTTSQLGRQIDSFIDVFTYLVTGALLFHFAIAPNVLVSAVVGFLLLCFGGLRLIRFNQEGFGSEDGTAYYRGMTVVHANLVVLANYFLLAFVPLWNGWLAALTVAAVCPMLVSDWRSYKTAGIHTLVGVLGTVAVGLCLVLEFGH
jgi:CDP-diacylglycerol--serine O-phosphatidyltransferase